MKKVSAESQEKKKGTCFCLLKNHPFTAMFYMSQSEKSGNYY
jgi:hypothetical protein